MSDRAAFAGIAANPKYPNYQRVQIANQALDQYVAIEDELIELLEGWQARADSDNPSEYLDMSEMCDSLREILEKKR